MTESEEKRMRVLDAIKARWDNHPKKGYKEDHVTGFYYHPPGEMDIYSVHLIKESGVTYSELEPILYKLQEDGLIEQFNILSDFG